MSARIIAFCARSSASQSERRYASCSIGVDSAPAASSGLSMGVRLREGKVRVGTADSKPGKNPHQLKRGPEQGAVRTLWLKHCSVEGHGFSRSREDREATVDTCAFQRIPQLLNPE